MRYSALMLQTSEFTQVASPLLSVHKSCIAPADVRRSLYRQGLPSGIRMIEPWESQMSFENGYNPDDYVELVLNDAYDLCALTLTMEKVRSIIRKTMPETAKVFYVFGEEHFMSVHRMAQACFAAILPHCLFGHEQPINRLTSYANIVYDVNLSELSLETLKEADPKGHLYAAAVMSRNRFSTPLVLNQLMSTVVSNGNVWVNIDAMTKKYGEYDYIDECDPLLEELVINVFHDKSPKLSRLPLNPFTTQCNNQGSIIRNFIMARRVFEEAIRHSALDIVMGVGLAHLGDKIDNIAYEKSLPVALLGEAKARNETATVISLFPTTYSNGCLPQTIIPPKRTAGHIPLIVHGLAETRHTYMHDYADNILDFLLEPLKRKKQRDFKTRYLNKLARSFHLAGQSDHPAIKSALKASIPQPYEQIKDRLKALRV